MINQDPTHCKNIVLRVVYADKFSSLPTVLMKDGHPLAEALATIQPTEPTRLHKNTFSFFRIPGALNKFQQDAVKDIIRRIGRVGVEELVDVLTKWGNAPFGLAQQFAFMNLLTNPHRRITAKAATEMLHGLNNRQVDSINDITAHMGAIDNLGDVLREWKNPPEFGFKQKIAFTNLVTDEKMAPADALAKVYSDTDMRQEEVINDYKMSPTK